MTEAKKYKMIPAEDIEILVKGLTKIQEICDTHKCAKCPLNNFVCCYNWDSAPLITDIKKIEEHLYNWTEPDEGEVSE